MDLKRGYKQTGAGVIPEDWDVSTLGPLTVKVGSGITPRGGERVYKKEGRPFLRSQNVGWGVLLLDDIAFIDEETHASFSTTEIKCNDVLLNITGASIGRSAIADLRLAGGNVNQHVCIIRVDSINLDSRFLNLFLLSEKGQKQIDSFQAGGNRQGLNFEQIRSFLITLPPFPEQRTIATALSDVDALLSALDALIAKKCAIKQGTMQELLTGKRRLPGFRVEWENVNIAQHSILKARIGWQGLTTAEYQTSGDYGLVTGTDFVDGKIDWGKCHFVEKIRYDQDKNIQLHIDDVLITKDGTIGKVAYIDHLPYPTTLNSGVFVLRPKNARYFPLFLYYVLNSKIFGDFLTQLQAGSTINHLYQKNFVNFSFLAPSYDEQRAIATVLSDMDGEIAALEQRREKTHLLKLGMMQELLTGRIRLL
jgi:type I restriction enzyme S subunit